MKKAPIFAVILILLMIGIGAYSLPNRDANPQAMPTQPIESRARALSEPEIQSMLFEIDKSFSGGTLEHRKQLARTLNEAYFKTKSVDLRRKISNALTRLLKSEADTSVARAIAMSHSRLYFDDNTIANLKDAYERKVLSFDDYYGELAHVFPGAPPEVREGIIRDIAASHNRYAVDIVASNINGDNKMVLSEYETTELQKFLRTNEPIFSGTADAYGQFEAIRYEQWILAGANLAKSTGSTSAEQFMVDKLLDSKTDPRALVAIATSPFMNSLPPEQRNSGSWALIQSKAQDFINKNPANPSLQLAGQQIVLNSK